MFKPLNIINSQGRKEMTKLYILYIIFIYIRTAIFDLRNFHPFTLNVLYCTIVIEMISVKSTWNFPYQRPSFFLFPPPSIRIPFKLVFWVIYHIPTVCWNKKYWRKMIFYYSIIFLVQCSSEVEKMTGEEICIYSLYSKAMPTVVIIS